MASFVEGSKCESKSDRDLERIDLEILAVGKRSGLTFAEMNELRVRDLFAYVQVYTGGEDERPRKATQEDIDRLLA